MFPIRELGGSVLAFSGRILAGVNGEPPARQRAQVREQPGGPALQQGQRPLWTARGARVEVRRNGWALLCEGNFDSLALHQAGFGNALAPMGTAFTAAQAKLLGRFAQRVTLLFDGDAAGAKAVRAAYPLLHSRSARPRRRAAQGRRSGLLPARARGVRLAAPAVRGPRASSST